MHSLKKKYIKLDFIIDIKNYKQSFNKWLKVKSKVPSKKEEHSKSKEHIEKNYFNQYLHVIKPVIYNFHQITSKVPESQYGFYCDQLSFDQLQILKKVFQPLRKYDIVMGEGEKEVQIVKEEECQGFIDERKFEKIFRINVSQYPKNQEVLWWDNGLDMPEICFQGQVVKGKGEGKKSLGMPTANLQIYGQNEQKLVEYPNGVYLVDFEFIEGRTYRGAGCLGTNPHYENFQQKRRVEVYVIHDFGQNQFYGENVKVTIKRLIRFEGKFNSFDSFLHAMHNDIYIAENHGKQKLTKL